MESKRTATTYFIPPGKFLLMENALGNPDLIQSSVSSDCRVTIVDLENFPLDDLEQWPTFRLISSDIKLKLGEGKYHIYIVVPAADNTESTSAFISYNTRLVDRKGYAQDGTLLGKAGFRYYPCGTVSERGGNPSATTTPSGQGRVVEMDLGVTPTVTNLPGNLSDLEEVFHIEKSDPSNPSSWLMTIVGTVKSMTARIIRVTSSLIFGSGENERRLVGVAVRKDATTPGMVSDTIIATTAWVDAQFEHLDDRYLSKQKDDRTPHNLGVGKNLSVGGEMKSEDFVKGNLIGVGWSVYRDGNGNTVVETDRVVVRKDLSVSELIVNQETFSKGSTIFVKGGCTLTRVEEYDTFYRCYYNNEEGTRYSGFQTGDQARCQRYDKSYKGIIKYYWRLVVGVGDDYVDLSKTEADGIGVPEVGDDIAQLGNISDKTRQSAIVVSPDDGGSVVVWAGINSFSLSEKNMVGMGVNSTTGRAYLYGYGDMFFGDRKETSYVKFSQDNGVEVKGTLSVGTKLSDGRDLEEAIDNATPEGYQQFVESVSGSLEYLQKQIDGAIDSYYLDYNPSMDNYPAKDWTEKEKEAHLGDTFTNNSTGESWRFGKDGDKYQWIYIEDTATKKALAAAINAVDVADSKRRTFIKTPTLLDAYDVGDLWVNATYGQYSNDLLKCDVAKKANEPFDINHWSKASKYTDDGKVEELRISVNDLSGELEKLGVDIESVKQQTDREYTIWFFNYEPTLSNEPASNWTTPELKAEHDQDLFYYRDAGKAWRFEDGSWKSITDQDTIRALELIAQTRKDVSNFEYLKKALSEYPSTEIANGLLMTSLVAVQNKDKEVEAFLNGGDFAKSSEHGKLILAGGIPEGNGTLAERAGYASTRIYEDGTVETNMLKATGGTFSGIDVEQANISGVMTCSNNGYNLEISSRTTTGFPAIRWIRDSALYAYLGIEIDSSGNTKGYLSLGGLSASDGFLNISGDVSMQSHSNKLTSLSEMFPEHYGIYMSSASAAGTFGSVFGQDSNKRMCIWSSHWIISKDQAPIGGVYLDGDTLKVRTI